MRDNLRSRFLILAVATAVLTMNSVSARAQGAVWRLSGTETNTDERAVYGLALKALYANGEERPGVIVIFDSLSYGQSYDCGHPPCLSPSIDSWVEPQTLTVYRLALRSRGLFPSGVIGPAPILLVSTADLDSLRNEPPSRDVSPGREANPFWDAFRRKFPAAWGLTTFSKIGFNARIDQALVQVNHTCGQFCYRMESMFFQKSGGSWHLDGRYPESAHDWVAQGELRYPGPDAQMHARYLKEQDSTRRAIADSIVLDRAPRRVHGTVVNKQTGSPIPAAQIFVRSAPTYPNPWVRVVADSLGRYEVRNLPLGGTMLEAQCPGPGPRLGATLDAPGLYVRPAVDTTINMIAPNIAPCWGPRRVHPLVSGWVESKEAVLAQTQTADERQVYATVIRELHARMPRLKVLATYSHTVPRCGYDEHCGTVQLAKLRRLGSIDSYIIEDFNRKTTKPIPLDPRFTSSLGLHVVTAQEIDYYAREANPFGEPQPGARNDTTLFWPMFEKLNGKRTGIISLSGIGFDAARMRALVEARLDTTIHDWMPPTTMLLLRKVAGRWRVEVKDVGRGITSGEWSGGKCEPANAPDSASTQPFGTLSGDFTVTLIPKAGSKDTGSVWMRISQIPRDSARWLTPKIIKNQALPPTFSILEIIDNTTGKPDDAAVFDYGIGGRGLHIFRNSNLVRLDGYSNSLTVLRVTLSGFFGSWSAGVFGPSEFGYFCATRR